MVYLTPEQTACAARVFLNIFGLILEEKEVIEEDDKLKIYDKDSNVVGYYYLENNQAKINAEYNGNILKASYLIPRTQGLVDLEDKAKYAKAIHDFMGDKERAIKSKFEIAKFMGELAKHNGDLGETLNDQGFVKATKLDLKALKAGISNDEDGGSTTYILKK